MTFAASMLLAAATAAPAPAAFAQDLSGDPAAGQSVLDSPLMGPYITIGSGGLLAVTGGILWLLASSDASDLRAKYGEREVMSTTDQQTAVSAELRGRMGSALVALGVLGAAGGGVWWYVMTTRSGETVLSLRVDF